MKSSSYEMDTEYYLDCNISNLAKLECILGRSPADFLQEDVYGGFLMNYLVERREVNIETVAGAELRIIIG